MNFFYHFFLTLKLPVPYYWINQWAHLYQIPPIKLFYILFLFYVLSTELTMCTSAIFSIVYGLFNARWENSTKWRSPLQQVYFSNSLVLLLHRILLFHSQSQRPLIPFRQIFLGYPSLRDALHLVHVSGLIRDSSLIAHPLCLQYYITLLCADYTVISPFFFARFTRRHSPFCDAQQFSGLISDSSLTAHHLRRQYYITLLCAYYFVNQVFLSTQMRKCFLEK